MNPIWSAKAMSVHDVIEAPQAVILNKSKNKRDIELISKSIKRHFILANLQE
jgi:hypothetical protein